MENTMAATQPSAFTVKVRGAPLETLASGDGSKKVEVMGKWRAEIDTSAPFESVKEAVDRFGGSAVWKPQLKQKHHSVDEFEYIRLQKHTARLGKDLIAKEQETLKVVNELEVTKRIVNRLKSQLHEESFEANKFPQTLSENTEQSPGSILFELEQAKMNLMRTTSYLTEIRASIELFNVKVDEEKSLLEKNRGKLSSKQSAISSLEEDLKILTFKLQLAKETSETGDSIKAAEFAENKADNSAVVLSKEEYAALTQRVREGDELPSKIVEAAMVEVERANWSKLALVAKIEEAVEDVKISRKVLEEALNRLEAVNRGKRELEEALRKCRSEYYSRKLDQNLQHLLAEDPRGERKHALSIGEILCRKLMDADDCEYDVGICDRRDRDEATTVSLGRLINRNNRVLSTRMAVNLRRRRTRTL